MDQLPPSLDSIGSRFGTDKASRGHDYLAVYEPLLRELRHTNVRLLEVGVLFGASLSMWRTYSPRDTLIGAEIHRGREKHPR